MYNGCLNPIIAFPPSQEKNMHNELLYIDKPEVFKMRILGNLKKLAFDRGNKYVSAMLNDEKVVLLPCRQCINCRLNRSLEWSIRNTFESQDYDEDKLYFLTLTYDNDNVNKNNGFLSLSRSEITNFMKRMRNYFKNDKFRFFACGEYGTKTLRPHYHLLLYGLKIPDLDKLYTYNNNNYYNSKIISDIWGNGFVYISNFSNYTAMYVSQYCTKKIHTGMDSFMKNKLIQPEFIQMSNRPGIAYNYFKNHKEEIYKKDGYLWHKDYETINVRPAKYFDRLYDLENPHNFQFIKDNRKKFSREYNYLINYDEKMNLSEKLSNMSRIKQNSKKGGREYGESNKK